MTESMNPAKAAEAVAAAEAALKAAQATLAEVREQAFVARERANMNFANAFLTEISSRTVTDVTEELEVSDLNHWMDKEEVLAVIEGIKHERKDCVSTTPIDQVNSSYRNDEMVAITFLVPRAQVLPLIRESYGEAVPR